METGVEDKANSECEGCVGVPVLSVVIVNYRTPKLTWSCLMSLVPERSATEFQVVVVDNASGDESVGFLKQRVAENGFASWIQVIEAPRNGGFSYGNNLGIAAVPADLYFLLNSDTVVHTGTIRRLLDFGQGQPDCGAWGPCLLYPDGTKQISCFRFPTALSEFERGASLGVFSRCLKRRKVVVPPGMESELEWISFAAVVIRHKVFQDVGFLDEEFFMYFEDVEFCQRICSAGWKISFLPEAVVTHIHSQSSGVAANPAAARRRPRYYYESRSRFFRKSFGSFGFLFVNIAWCLGRMFAVVRELLGKPKSCSQSEWRDIWTGTFRRISATSR